MWLGFIHSVKGLKRKTLSYDVEGILPPDWKKEIFLSFWLLNSK
jgi:hypothetical protein